MPEPDDLAALTAELERLGDVLFAQQRKRILAALRRAKEWKRLLEESDNYGAFCRMKQTIAELRAGLEAIALDRCHCSYECAHELIEGGYCNSCIARQALARTAPPENDHEKA